MIKRIVVNKHVIKANSKLADWSKLQPPLSIQHRRGPTYAHAIEIHGASHVCYRPEKPLKCGATVWIETHARLSLFDANGDSLGGLD